MAALQNGVQRAAVRRFFIAGFAASLLGLGSPLPASEIRVVDDLGNVLTLEQAATRIISLSPHNTENLFTAGAGNYVVGTVAFSDHPEAAAAIPRMGNAQRIQLEAVLQAEPDLIVAWASGNSPQTLARLQDLGVPVYFSEPRSFADVIDNLRDLATLTGQNPNAEPIATLEKDFAALIARYEDNPPVRVFYQIWDTPLMSLNNEHMVGKLLAHCNGKNIFADAPTLSPIVSREAVLAANPEVILLASSANDAAHWQSTWQRWKTLSAIRSQRVHVINPDWVNRQTARLLLGMEQICRALSPASAD